MPDIFTLDALPAPPLPRPGEQWALFLDIDGTLVDFETNPDDVKLPPDLRLLLERVRSGHGDALAILSGRSLSDVDRVTAPCEFVAGAMHGAERRSSSGEIVRMFAPESTSERVGRACADGVRQWGGVSVESKNAAAFAIHYRQAPAMETNVRELAQMIAEDTGGEFAVQFGELVAELKPSGATKGASVLAFAGEAPFAGRRPVVVGDDLTDESAFKQALALGGFGIIVGDRRPTQASYALQGPAATRAWLHELACHLQQRTDSG